MNIYRNRKEVANYLGIDPRTVDTLIKDKLVIEVSYDDKIRYLVLKDLFKYISE